MWCSAKSIKHARAYLNFADPMHVYDFKAAFDGHVFVNERGAQFRCVVEYAPYQKVPKKINKRDPREGTLEKGDLPLYCQHYMHLSCGNWMYKFTAFFSLSGISSPCSDA